MTFFRIAHSRHSRRPPRRSVRLQLEALEDRTVPYAATGNMWPHPQLVTISFQPDGTNLGGPTSNMFSTFNGWFGSATTWENVILKAAQTWAEYTNINFSVVSDNGTGSGGGLYQQGDPGMGDIRIGGYNFNNPGLLALASYPPPVNNYSIAGDITFNTGAPFNINGSDYDLYTVAMHEIGHALGLAHTTDPNAVMFAVYNGVMTDLGDDDIAGIQSIYSGGSGRSPDAYDAAASNGTTATASNISSQIDPLLLTATVNNLDITTTSDVDYYKFTAPSNSGTSLTATVQSSGLSLLAPSLKIYNASGALLGSATGSGDSGSTVNKTVTITPGQQYYVRVAGANTTPFGTGAYALSLKLGAVSPLPVTLPITLTLDGIPLHGGGGIADRTDGHGHHQHRRGGDFEPFEDAYSVATDPHGHGAVLAGAGPLGVSAFAPQFVSADRTPTGNGSEDTPPAPDSGDSPPDGALAAWLAAAVETHAGTWDSAVDQLFADPSWSSE